MSSPALAHVFSRVESITGRMTMYRLVLSCLAALAAVGLLCSVVGAITYSPAALVISLVVVLLASYGSNRAISAMFAVVPHSESSLISGFLLFFIFPPSTQRLPVLGLALAAMLANGSKYILAVRGRHLFNPAAAGAFVLTLTGIYYSGWWAGNPVLLPFTLVIAALILHRTRRIGMGLVFIACSAGIMVLRSLAGGIDLSVALTWPLTSSPMIFFAGLMLSEPLTQPPLRWQQLTFAAIVGSLFSIPLHAGPIYLAPESALLIGNGLSFLVGQRRGIELVLQRRSELTPTTSEFAFRPTRKLSFRPGQYLELTLPHRGADSRGLRRVFSIASAPRDAELVCIGTKVPDRASTFKQTLDQLPEGAVVSATSISGDFLLPRNRETKLLLIAGGIGITPFASQLADLSDGHGRDIVLLYSVSDRAEVSYAEVLRRAAVRVVLISLAPMPAIPDHWATVRSSRVDSRLLREQVPDICDRQVLVSGPPAMVDGVGAAARALHARSVKTDYFSGY
jgi:ferredoxin-NADP reductase